MGSSPWKSMMASFSHGSNQKSRGTQPRPHSFVHSAAASCRTHRDPRPMNGSADADLSLLRQAPDEIHHLIPHIVREPSTRSEFPKAFFLRRCALPSARPGPRLSLHLFLTRTMRSLVWSSS